MPQEIKFYIEGSKAIRPSSKKTIFVDGADSKFYREGIDIELSHWIPNKTEEKYKAGTSTEICFNYLLLKQSIDYELVVNNHVDIDGLLSVFVLSYPTVALKNKDIIIKAAEIGDFWTWGEGKALELFQRLSLSYQKLEVYKRDPQEIYEKCFNLVLEILCQETFFSEAHEILKKQWAYVEKNLIIREELNSSMVIYYVPKKLTNNALNQFLYSCGFNEPISQNSAFWLHVRYKMDREKMHLMAVESDEGVYYELFLPGYCWADTKGLWRPEFLTKGQTAKDLHKINGPFLSQIILSLNEAEKGNCLWHIFPGVHFTMHNNARPYPAMMSTLDKENKHAPSNLKVDHVKEMFSKIVFQR